MNQIEKKLKRDIENSKLPSYIYGYPSKRAYRKFKQPISLGSIWKNKRGSVNLYIHIPFCNYRCTYCTLFMTHNNEKLIAKYVQALIKQIKKYGELAGHLTVSSIYFGGGTPTVLTCEQFNKIFDVLNNSFPYKSNVMEIAVEGSPETITMDKLLYLKKLGVNRISIGIQTLDAEELKRTGRPHSVETSVQAIKNTKRAGYTNFNLDLIYGLEKQTDKSFFDSLDTVLSFEPDTLCLYPVVIRPKTSIKKSREKDKLGFIEDRDKYEIYDKMIPLLKEKGYKQESFVRFTRLDYYGYKQQTSDFKGIPLIGLGAGARSYAGDTHYSTDYAISTQTSKEIISSYINYDFDVNTIDYGIVLNEDEQKRRYIILNLVLSDLDYTEYHDRFNCSLFDDFGSLFEAFENLNLITMNRGSNRIRLTDKGFKYSSLVGSLFYSDKIKNLENDFVYV